MFSVFSRFDEIATHLMFFATFYSENIKIYQRLNTTGKTLTYNFTEINDKNHGCTKCKTILITDISIIPIFASSPPLYAKVENLSFSHFEMLSDSQYPSAFIQNFKSLRAIDFTQKPLVSFFFFIKFIYKKNCWVSRKTFLLQ